MPELISIVQEVSSHQTPELGISYSKLHIAYTTLHCSPFNRVTHRAFRRYPNEQIERSILSTSSRVYRTWSACHLAWFFFKLHSTDHKRDDLRRARASCLSTKLRESLSSTIHIVLLVKSSLAISDLQADECRPQPSRVFMDALLLVSLPEIARRIHCYS